MPFNPPPNWPVPPHRDWTPAPGWRPPAQWGPAPPGWDFGEWPGKDTSVFARTGEPHPETAKRWGRATNAFINHPLWTTAGALLGIVGLVLSGFQIYQATQSKPEDLEVSMTSFAGPTKVQAVSYDGPTHTYGAPVDATATPVDITLQNNGGEPSLITQVVATVTYADKLKDCTSTGAGPLRVSAEYTITIPDKDGLPASGTYTKDVRFEVKPETVDRMTITVGPEFESADNFPYVVGFDVALVHDDGSRLDAGQYALVSNLKAADANIERSTSAGCAAANLESIDQVYTDTSVKSDELERLRTAYQSLVG